MTDCAKASLSAVGELFEGAAGLASLQETLQEIGADCKTALSGSSPA